MYLYAYLVQYITQNIKFYIQQRRWIDRFFSLFAALRKNLLVMFNANTISRPWRVLTRTCPHFYRYFTSIFSSPAFSVHRYFCSLLFSVIWILISLRFNITFGSPVFLVQRCFWFTINFGSTRNLVLIYIHYYFDSRHFSFKLK